MAQKPVIDASQALIDLIFVGLNYGIDVARSSGTWFAPVVLMDDLKGERLSPVMIDAEAPEDLINASYEVVSGIGAVVSRYIIIVDAYATIEGQKYDAVLVEGGERGKPFALQFAQRYRPASGGEPFDTVGNPAYLGQTTQRLSI